MKENPLNKTTPLEMERSPTVAYHSKKEDVNDVKVNVISIIAVVSFGLGYFAGSY